MNNTENHFLLSQDLSRKPSIRELTLEHGLTFPSDEELVMLILGKGTKNNPIEKLSSSVINAIDSCNQQDLIHKLLEIDGMGISRALSIAAAIEFGRRRNAHFRATVEKPTDIIPYVQHYSLRKTEHFLCATINGAHELINIRVISVGTINKTLIHPREIFADAVTEHASGIICCHNHPYGACFPSQADRDSTKVLQNAAAILGITFMDHIIITRNEYFSFLEHGLLN